MTAAEQPKKPIPAPKNLTVAGRRVWRAITDKYDLRADELRVLEDACREADLIDVLSAAAKGAKLLLHGSQGQPVINPLISELRQHRATLAGLLRQLRLPDTTDTPQTRSEQARAAVNTRWAKRGA